MTKIQKILLSVIAVLMLVQIPWYFVVQSNITKTMNKTVATVISVTTFPTYEYFDASGHRYVKDDRYFGEYKYNNPVRDILLKQVGDKVPAYYTKDKPEDVLFMASVWAYSPWLMPLFIAVPLFVIYLIIIIRLKILHLKQS